MFVMRLSFALYCDFRTFKRVKWHEEDEMNSETNHVSMIDAVGIVLNQKIDKVLQKSMFKWQGFRDQDLWNYDCELIFTMNEGQLQALFKKYAKKNLGNEHSETNPDWLTYEACLLMMNSDCPLQVSQRKVNEAYALCKMTVINEFDPGSENQYRKMVYVEFLEFLGRIAHLYFEKSEMNELELY